MAVENSCLYVKAQKQLLEFSYLKLDLFVPFCQQSH